MIAYSGEFHKQSQSLYRLFDSTDGSFIASLRQLAGYLMLVFAVI